jgi:hypothetical protein
MNEQFELFKERDFHIRVLGRTLEHLGVQMYKRRDIAFAELVANSWDAGAKEVRIFLPQEYGLTQSEIIISDDGMGMNEDEVQDLYLMVGRNRKKEDQFKKFDRPIIGKKGIGKLAGFGIAKLMTILTWKHNIATTLTLDIDRLKKDADTTENVVITGKVGPMQKESKFSSGTTVRLSNLKHLSPLDVEKLMESLSRRFSRRIKGEMKIYVNDSLLNEPNIDFIIRQPIDGMEDVSIDDGKIVRYYYGFSSSTIKSKELQGFTIYINGKTAQAPPFHFNVEGTATGFHWAKYLSGEIEADFLDEGIEDEDDLISTDRQEIDWADPRTEKFRKWGEEVTKKALLKMNEFKAERFEDLIMSKPELKERVDNLDGHSIRQVKKLIKQLSRLEPDVDQAYSLADSLIRVYEYKHFHDIIEKIESAEDEPEKLSMLLSHISEWQTIESRAILAIISGRIKILEKFHNMLVNNFPETASKKNPDNLHDLIARFPWILSPEFQIFSEEKTISKQLREWNVRDTSDEDERLRYDFLAITDDNTIVVIDIKRSGYPINLDDLQRLEKYKSNLSKAHDKKFYMLMICSDKNLDRDTIINWDKREDGEIRNWSEIFSRTNNFYNDYKAVLEGDIQNPSFKVKEAEVIKTRQVLETGSVKRTIEERRKGI